MNLNRASRRPARFKFLASAFSPVQIHACNKTFDSGVLKIILDISQTFALPAAAHLNSSNLNDLWKIKNRAGHSNSKNLVFPSNQIHHLQLTAFKNSLSAFFFAFLRPGSGVFPVFFANVKFTCDAKLPRRKARQFCGVRCNGKLEYIMLVRLSNLI